MTTLSDAVIGARRARNLTEVVVEHVGAQISSGALKPGEKLPTESQLMQTLGVSRTVIREAISRLQASAVIETRHGIGSFVRDPKRPQLAVNIVQATTLADVLSILELRISLETESAGLAAQRAAPADIALIRQALDAITMSEGSLKDSATADAKFHLSIARATGNRHFADILSQLGASLIPRTRIDSARLAQADPSSYMALVNVEHENILDAIMRHDVEGAKAAMRMHLSNSRERLRKAGAELPSSPV